MFNRRTVWVRIRSRRGWEVELAATLRVATDENVDRQRVRIAGSWDVKSSARERGRKRLGPGIVSQHMKTRCGVRACHDAWLACCWSSAGSLCCWAEVG